jgi:hypothetical protein
MSQAGCLMVHPAVRLGAFLAVVLSMTVLVSLGAAMKVPQTVLLRRL